MDPVWRAGGYRAGSAAGGACSMVDDLPARRAMCRAGGWCTRIGGVGQLQGAATWGSSH